MVSIVFFINVGPNVAKQIKNPSHVSVENYMQESNKNTMFLDPVDCI